MKVLTEALFSQRFAWLLLTAATFSAAACVQPTSNTPTNSAVTNSNSSPVANATPIDDKKLDSVVVTFPILDALLADENIASELKSQAKLSDEEIQKVKDAARQNVLELGEEAGDNDYARSTAESAKAAAKKLEEILGSEKANQFISAVRTHIADLGQPLQTAVPNSIPTDTRIVVNAPAYRMDVFQDGKLIRTYKIGIGYPEFPLPVGLRKAETIIFNPTWTPPDEPWVKGKFAPGKKVEAGSKDNPLGPLKVPIGLPNLIHGGKAPGRIGTFASHGCVGLTNEQANAFALLLASLTNTKLDQSELKEFEKAKTETHDVKLGMPMPVELRYETIVVENGKLKIYRDVYENGTNTEENLRRVLEVYGVSLDDIAPADRDKILAGLKLMARDAQGNPVAVGNANDNRSQPSKSDKVTKNPKGKTEIEFELPQLQGKGYPAPVVQST